MNNLFLTKAKKLYLESYANRELCDLNFSTTLNWIFANLFEKVPITWSFLGGDKEDAVLCPESYHEQSYNSFKSFKNILKEYEKDSFRHGGMLINEDGIFTEDYFLLPGKLPERIQKCLVPVQEEHHFLYASMGSNGFSCRQFPIREVQEDILDNYNDDLPIDKFKEFIESNESGIAISYSGPGAGKTYFLRYLIAQYPDKQFIWFDQSLLTQATSDAFVNFIISHKNSILILEDCEMLLKSREQTNNGLLSTVLNIADGIIGDSLKIKFLCTFNTDLTNIDKAVTRKGRLKVQYEFKALTKEKVSKLFDKFGIEDEPREMQLCDVYNYKTVTGGEQKIRKRIGF